MSLPAALRRHLARRKVIDLGEVRRRLKKRILEDNVSSPHKRFEHPCMPERDATPLPHRQSLSPNTAAFGDLIRLDNRLQLLDGRNVQDGLSHVSIFHKSWRYDKANRRWVPAGGIVETRPMNEADLKHAVGRRLRHSREALGYSQGAVCRILKVNQTRWSNWEIGERFPAPDIIVRYCNHFGITTDYLYRNVNVGLPQSVALKIAEIEQAEIPSVNLG
ncbi:MAG: helix-turn-helix domain-containing protein [Azospirillum sp.]|nr:helix-turn-helix domain-containing protein [Azospirillum sp.]